MGWISPPITPRELQEWAAFERVNGPILIHERVEMSVAIAALTSAAPYSKKKLNIIDFMPWWDAGTPRPGAQTPEDIIDVLRSMANRKPTDDDGEDEDTFYADDGNVRSQSTPRRRVE